jgi:hypothetical protein
MSFYPIDQVSLSPVPNVNETEYFSEILEKDDTPVITNLNGVHLTVLTTHRGKVLYCAGGVTVYRISPTSSGGNGHYNMPPHGTEETVDFETVNGRFRGQIIFCLGDV